MSLSVFANLNSGNSEILNSGDTVLNFIADDLACSGARGENLRAEAKDGNQNTKQCAEE